MNDQEQTIIQPSGIVDVQRRKNATVTLHPPANCMKEDISLIWFQIILLDNFLYIAIFTTIGVFLLIYFFAFGIMCKHPDI